MKRVVVVVLTVGLLSCGSNGHRGVSATASAALRTQVEQIRAAASIGDAKTAAEKLAELRTQAATLHSQHQLTDAAMARILAGATDVEQNLTLISTTTATTTTPPTTSQKNDNGKGHGGGDKGDGDGGD